MRSKLGRVLLLLLLASDWTDDLLAAVAPRLATPAASSDEVVPLAITYRKQILEKIETPLLLSIPLDGAGIALAAPDHPPEQAGSGPPPESPRQVLFARHLLRC